MPHICPRPCSRLATAAVFISVGVVQFIVGIILLKSKYVYLLSGPDIWTSLSNISVGCLLGLSASIWKDSQKKRSAKHIIRRNVLTALLFSALIINATTAGILILGEGNTLLSIQLENNEKHGSATLAGEILAYAYATSVCSPIVCIVVAIVFISANCFQKQIPKHPKTPKTPAKDLQNELPYHYDWVYTPEVPKPLKCPTEEHVLTSSSDSSLSSADELFTEPVHASDVPLQKKDIEQNIHEVVYKVVAAKLSAALSDGKIANQFLRTPCVHSECSMNRAGSYEGPRRHHGRDLCANDKILRRDGVVPRSSPRHERSRSFNKELLDSKLSCLSTSSDECVRDILRRSREKEARYRDSEMHRLRQNSNIETSAQYQNIYMQQYANSQSPTRQGPPLKQPSVKSHPGKALRCPSSNLNGHSQVAALVHEEGRQSSESVLPRDELPAQEKFASIQALRKRSNSVTFSADEQILPLESDGSEFTTDLYTQKRKELLSDESETGADSSFEQSKSSSVGEVVPILINSSSQKRPMPVPPPKIPINHNKSLPECGSEETKSESDQNKFDNRDASLSSFKNNSRLTKKESMPEYVRGPSKSQLGKKLDLAFRTSSMEPISEVPTEETNGEVHLDSSVQTSSYISSPEGNYYVSSEEDDISKNVFVEDPSGSATPVSASISSHNMKYFEEYGSKRESSSMKLNKTPQSCMLRKLWSSAGPDVKMEFLDQIVDGDSLIGLSEKDLITRQFRTRSLRKAIQQRMKQKTKV